jgi:putative DNA primase/helicase
METIFAETMDNDREKISFLRRAAGYSLVGDISEHCFMLLHGTGANGKSVFVEILRSLLGDYAVQADFSTFLVTKGNAIRNDIARLRGSRLVTAVESDAGRRLAENVVKHMTGGDTVAARFLYSEHFEFVPTFKLWLATNHRPRITGGDEAIWRRVRLVPFAVTIPPESRDLRLIEKLKAELSGILNWALVGLAEWRQGGLAVPDALVDAGEEYRRHEDSLGRFVDEHLTLEAKSEVGAGELYRVYSEWAYETGEFRMREKEFTEAMESRGLRKKRKSVGIFWQAIRFSM